MGLLVTLHLISSNVYGSLKAPQKRGFSYIEIWVLGTQGTILFAIIEYGIVLAWKKYGKKPDPIVDIDAKKLGKWFEAKLTKEEIINIVDKLSLLFSLIMFSCFNIFYWAFTHA